MFRNFKKAIDTPPRKGKQQQSSLEDNSKPIEDESTSLLSSKFAPHQPPMSMEETEQSNHQLPQVLSTKNLTAEQGVLSIEEMERGAKRLISDNIGDTDSINNLLNEDEDDSSMSSSYSIHGATGDDEGYSDIVTIQNNLNYLTSLSNKQQQRPAGKENTTRQRRASVSRRERVDEIGNQLLEAQGDARLEHDILRKSLNLNATDFSTLLQQDENDTEYDSTGNLLERIQESTRRIHSAASIDSYQPPEIEKDGLLDYEIQRKRMVRQFFTTVGVTFILILLAFAALGLGTIAVGPPRQPVGAYKIIEAQVGHDFWQYYDFYAGKDSAGSNGHIMYVSEQKAREEGIVDVVTATIPTEEMIEIYADGDPRAEEDWLAEDVAFLEELKKKEEEEDEESEIVEAVEIEKKKKKSKEKKASRLLEENDPSLEDGTEFQPPKLEPFNPDSDSDELKETFVYISSSPTQEGPRNSVRLEGRRRFNRGLFIIDLRHMPAGCGTWPAFWLTDEANWPVNGEIDIVEGVNYQDTAKTALHTTKECRMDDVPEGSKTGTWDTAVGIPDSKTGIPDMTFRYAQDCFVYDPHQWINQGCVATDLKTEGRSLGVPLNQNGGGVYALEWDPVYKHIKTWVFSPHNRVPSNLRDAMRTATNADESTRVAPDTNQWGLPYGHFPIGDGTNCPSGHFRNMRLVINLAFCGSVSGNRYFMDCPKQVSLLHF